MTRRRHLGSGSEEAQIGVIEVLPGFSGVCSINTSFKDGSWPSYM